MINKVFKRVSEEVDDGMIILNEFKQIKSPY